MTGCETNNKYNIFEKKEGKMKKDSKIKLWQAKEKSECYQRNCLDNACRALDIKIKNETNMDKDITCVRIHKDCTCTCLCFNRPVFYVDYVEEQSEQFLGQI